MKSRYGTIVVVHVLLLRHDGQVLLLQRAGTGEADGQLCLPGGHLEDGESVVAGAIRETAEETGIELAEAHLEFVHVVHRRHGGDDPRLGFFFLATGWQGQPVNTEPHKCAGLVWADPAKPPATTIAYTVAALAQISNGRPFSLDGWTDRSPARVPVPCTRRPEAFTVEIERRITAVQGLPSPVRAQRGLPPIPAGDGIDVVLRAGIAFGEDQLTDRGWFADTDATAEILDRCCAELSRQPWTQVFAFRSTFELVARHLYRQLAEQIPQLAFLELRDDTFGVTTRYAPNITCAGGCS
ncbi:NUDIX hydrolase [Actinoplanes flavus]|uniref:NUDIX domain-containing protein n=1 Tax=Actinoplanes flavus TaxID=2820290 RepID=A0ABS3UD70_9ACTN|nr:NUDIX domain-containing protein [Actinoplanes flavus]MBO3736725.1 NUDIX domain-containing protein [Actinoplanes flavus]